MTREFQFIEMEDDADLVYLVSVPANTSQRYAEVVAERFENLFDEAEVIMADKRLETADRLKVQVMDHEDFKAEAAEAEDDG